MWRELSRLQWELQVFICIPENELLIDFVQILEVSTCNLQLFYFFPPLTLREYTEF